MITVTPSGHYRSVRTAEEERTMIEYELRHLGLRERSCVMELIEKGLVGDTDVADEAADDLWETPPVPIEVWLEDENLIGDIRKSIFPQHKRDIIEFFNGGYHEYILTGGTGVGKCQAVDSLLQTGRGVLKIQEIFDFSGSSLLHSESGPRHTTYQADEGKKRSVRVETHSGAWAEGTPHHRYRVLTSDFKIEWRRSDELELGDYLVRKPGDPNLWGTRAEIDGFPLTEAFAKLVGLWVAEGHYVEEKSKQAKFCNGEGREKVEQVCEGSGGDVRWLRFEKGSDYFTINGKAAEVIRRHCESGSGNKAIPRFIREAPKSVICAFLSGYFGGDGHVNIGSKGNGNIEVTSKSAMLIDEVQNILWCFGIKSRVTPKMVDGKLYKRLHITDKWSKVKFRDTISFCFKRKQDELEFICDDTAHERDNDHVVIPFAKQAWRESFMRRPKHLRSKKHPSYGRWDSVFHARKPSKGEVTRKAVKQALDDPEVAVCVDPLLKRIIEEGLEFDLVVGLTPGEVEMYDFTVEGDPSYVSNGFISHNTFTATICIMRILYELLCLKSPQEALGSAAGSPIYLVPISKTKELARRVAFGQIASKLMLSPFFRKRFIQTKEEIRFPDKSIYIIGGASSDAGILGMDVVAGLVDEGNFMGIKKMATRSDTERFDAAETVYNGLVNRIQSRLARHGLTGFVFLVSSKRGAEDFTERRVKQVMLDSQIDPKSEADWEAKIRSLGVFVRDYSTWGIVPEKYKDQKWWCMAYNPETGRTRIIKQGAPLHRGEKGIDFPNDFLADFKRDPIGSLRDKAGVSVEVANPFITNRSFIDEMMDKSLPYIFSVTEWNTDNDLDIYWDKFITKNARNEAVPVCCPNVNRHVALDLSLTGDATGFAIGHDAGVTEVLRRDRKSGRETVEMAPMIHLDCVLRIVPPSAGEIEHEKIRDLIYRLRDGGLPIRWVSLDQWSRGPNAQLLRKAGLKDVKISVDAKTDPYLTMRAALYERRLKCPYHEHLRKELRRLELAPNGRKVDHPSRGSKDIADAFTATVYHLSEISSGHRVYVPSKGLSAAPKAKGGWQAGDYIWGDEKPKGQDDGDDLPRYIVI